MRFGFISLLLSFLFFCSSAFSDTLVLKPENTISLRGQVSQASVSKAIQEILTSKEDTLYLHLNSPGGSIFAGLELVETIKNSGKKIICVADFAASMAFVILQSCHERYVTNYGVLMQHVASYGLNGNEPNNFKMAKFIRKVVRKLNREQAKRIGLSPKEFYSKTRSDWWIFGDDAVKNNTADKVTGLSCSKELIDQVEEVTVPVFIFSVKLKFSKCPLITSPLEEPSPSKELTKEEQGLLDKFMLNYSPKDNMKK